MRPARNSTMHASLRKLNNGCGEANSKVIIKKLEKADYPINTVTSDNNVIFASHTEIVKALNMDTFFTRSYTSQDKGTVKYRNSQISKLFPKKD